MIRHLKLNAPFGEQKILLHSCCAPCSTAIVECLLYNSIKPTIFYFNPNIFPLDEYEIRRNESMRHAQILGLDYIEADYSHESWLKAVKGFESEPERGKRCQLCFNIRMTETAKFAAENGFKVFTTTLASSRWKDINQIEAAGHFAESKYPTVKYWAQNWRKGGLSERRAELLGEFSFYNQQYCGCEFSKKDK